MLILAKALVSAGMFGGDLAPMSMVALAMPAPVMPAPVMQARPPTPPRPPRINPPRRNPLQEARDRLAGRTIGGGRAVDRRRDRRFWDSGNQDQDRRKDEEKDEPEGMSPEEIQAQIDAVARIQKKLTDKTRRAKAGMNKAQDPESVKGKLAAFQVEYLEKVAKVAKETEAALKKGAGPPASLSKLMELPKRPKNLPKPKKRSFEEAREKFLLREAKDFGISSRSSKDRGVKELYQRFQRYVTQMAWQR